MRQRWMEWMCLLAWPSALLAGCAAAVDEANVPEIHGDVAVVSQALGNITYRWSGSGHTPIGSSPTHVLFIKGTDPCAEAIVSVNVQTGSFATMPFSRFDCRSPTGAAVDGEVFIQDDGSNEILRYTTTAAGPAWVKVTDTIGRARGLALSSVYVTWADTAGVFRIRRTGEGLREDVNPATDARLIAQDGSTVYYTVPSRYGTELRSMLTSGGSDRFLTTSANPITQLGFDANYVYWPDNTSSPRSIQRLHKVERVRSTVTSSTDRYYYTPQSTGSALYFVFLKDSQCTMSRRNLSNGNTVNAAFPAPFAPYSLHIGANEVQTAGVIYGLGPRQGIVHRGDL